MGHTGPPDHDAVVDLDRRLADIAHPDGGLCDGPASPGLAGLLHHPARPLLGQLGPEQQAHRPEGDGVDESRFQESPGEDQGLPQPPWYRNAHRVVIRWHVEELSQLGIGLQVAEELPHDRLKRARLTIRGKGTAHLLSLLARFGPEPTPRDRLLLLYCRGGTRTPGEKPQGVQGVTG